MDSLQTLNKFWNSFGWDAFNEATVPDNAFSGRQGYITYSTGKAEFERSVMLTASIWQRSTSWEDVISKAKEIERFIGLGGCIISYDDGFIWIKRGSPFYQTMSDEDDSVRRVYINVEVEYLTAI